MKSLWIAGAVCFLRTRLKLKIYSSLRITPPHGRCIRKKIELWRKNRGDISWFMRSLNEFIARMVSKEDNCKGRFKSQILPPFRNVSTITL